MTRPIKVLLADDPLGSAHTLLRSLDDHGISPAVQEVRTIADLSASLASAPCDLIVVSVLHPDQLADRLLEWLGPDPSAPPIIVVAPGDTPSNDPAVLRSLLQGARDYVGSEDVMRFAAAVRRALTVPAPDANAPDVLHARRLRDQMRLQGMQKMEAIGRLAGGIAHDFNNIVQAIGGHTEVLLRDLPPDDPRAARLQEIRRAGERAAALTRQLLAFSRQQVMQPRVLDLNEVVGTMENLLRRLIGADVQLRARLATDLWPVRADATQLEQVLMNLVVNARDAMPEGGTVTIETANTTLTAGSGETFTVAPGPYVLLSVSDTGVGMTPEIKGRAFEPFFTTKELGQGTGLGLSTVYGIVKQSGGYIWMDSEPGSGTRVRIYLPRERQIASREERRPAASLSRAGKETLLVVEDEEGVRDLIQDWLESHGYHVLAAGNGADALEVSAAYEGPIDLLVADVVMPEMGGPALAQRLLPERPGLKVMYMSGYADGALGDGRIDHGVPFLQKPFSLNTLVEKVRETLAG